MVPFVKCVAAGNDFLIIDERHAPADRASFTRSICDRYNGVGADGVEWVSSDAECDVRARLLNADGSFAEVSGNGTRCVAAWVVAERGAGTVRVRTDAGVKTCTLKLREGASMLFEADMGEPVVTGERTIHVAGSEVTGVISSMGNPHFSIFGDAGELRELMQTAPQIEGHEAFPQRTNVEFVKVEDRNTISVRFFERGAGWTKSSGTGSCGAAVAAIATQRCESLVVVRTEGGDQQVRWDGNVWLTGPAAIVCRGEFYL